MTAKMTKKKFLIILALSAISFAACGCKGTSESLNIEVFTTYSNTSQVEFVSEFVKDGSVGGRTGSYMKFSNKTQKGVTVEYPYIGIKPSESRDYYVGLLEEYSAAFPNACVIIPVYVTADSNRLCARGGACDADGWYGAYAYDIDPASEIWYDVRIPLKNFVYWYDDLSKQFIYVGCPDKLELDIYIGEMRVEKGRSAGSEREVEGVDGAEALASFETYEGTTPIALPAEYIGETTLGERTGNFIKFTNVMPDNSITAYPWIGIRPRNGKEYYAGLLDTYGAEGLKVVIPIFVKKNAENLRVRGGDASGADWYEELTSFDPKPQTWYDVEIPLENFVVWYDRLHTQFIQIHNGVKEFEFYIGGIWVQGDGAAQAY